MTAEGFIAQIQKLTPTQLEARTWKYVGADLFAEESSLYDTKWWDYKPLHPLHATYLFAEAYIAAFTRAMRQRKDEKVAHYIKPLKARNRLWALPTSCRARCSR